METHSAPEPSETAHFTEQLVKLDVLSSRVKVRLPTSNEEKKKKQEMMKSGMVNRYFI